MKTIDTIVTFLHKASLRPALYAGIASLALTGKAYAIKEHDARPIFYDCTSTSYSSKFGGKVEEEVCDTNNDGKSDLISKFDRQGNLIEEKRDDNADGKHDSISKFEYDRQGNMIKEERDHLGDGKIDMIFNYRYEYDAQGNVTKEFSNVINKEVNNTDRGEWILIHTYEYNGRGDRRKETSYSRHYGPIDEKTYTYDAQGNIIKEERVVYTGNGIQTFFSTKEPNARGDRRIITKYAIDHNSDGEPDFGWTYAYDDQDNIIKETYDDNLDGKPDFGLAYAYDAQGRMIGLIGDDHSQTQVNAITRIQGTDAKGAKFVYTFEHDPNRGITKKTLDFNADGKIDYVWSSGSGWGVGDYTGG